MDPEWYDKIPDPLTDEEQDMLDLAFGLTETWVGWGRGTTWDLSTVSHGPCSCVFTQVKYGMHNCVVMDVGVLLGTIFLFIN